MLLDENFRARSSERMDAMHSCKRHFDVARKHSCHVIRAVRTIVAYLVLDEKLDTLDGSGSGLRDGGGNTTH
jgi:sarcosine oxidase delta subunit